MKNLFVKCSIRKVLLLLFMCISFTDAFAQFQSKYGEYELYLRPSGWIGNEVTSWDAIVVHFEDDEAIFYTWNPLNLFYGGFSAIQREINNNPSYLDIWAKGDAPTNKYFTMKYDYSMSNASEECYKYYDSGSSYFANSSGWRYVYISKDRKYVRPGSNSLGNKNWVKANLSDYIIDKQSTTNKMKRNAPKEDGKIYE